MKSLLLLRNIKVENAIAIAGLTYGFPPITAFLGFVHALSRKLKQEQGLALGGVAVICHDHQVHAHRPGERGDYVFALTRNPLTKEGKTPAFVEEGRMSLVVSLLIECDFTIEDVDYGTGSNDEDLEKLLQFVETKVLTQRLAGGTIVDVDTVRFEQLEDDNDKRRQQVRRVLFRSLPGFALVDRSSLLEEHFKQIQATNPNAELMDAWLDYSALKREAVAVAHPDEQPTAEHKAEWKYVPKPSAGWLVPIAVGYKAISPLYQNSEVERTRDGETPFRFAELAYGLGQWLSPHRIENIEDLLWRYQPDDEWYLCKNTSSHSPSI